MAISMPGQLPIASAVPTRGTHIRPLHCSPALHIFSGPSQGWYSSGTAGTQNPDSASSELPAQHGDTGLPLAGIEPTGAHAARHWFVAGSQAEPGQQRRSPSQKPPSPTQHDGVLPAMDTQLESAQHGTVPHPR